MTAPVDVSYLADTVMLLRYFEARGRGAQGDLGGQEAHRRRTSARSASCASSAERHHASASRSTTSAACSPACPTYAGVRELLVDEARR